MRPAGPLLAPATREAGDDDESPLTEMEPVERMASDLLRTGVTVGAHPLALYRPQLDARGVVRACDLPRRRDGERVRVAGAVICRQRPGTAKGMLFMTLEDETGLVNVTVRPDAYEAYRALWTGPAVLEVTGVVQNREGCSVLAKEAKAAGPAERFAGIESRDFR